MGMHEASLLAGALMAGFLAGTVSFAGLWWATRRLVAGRAPWIVLAMGFLVRMGALAYVLWLATRGDASRLLAALVGFLVSRDVTMRVFRAGAAGGEISKGEAHAHQPR